MPALQSLQARIRRLTMTAWAIALRPPSRLSTGEHPSGRAGRSVCIPGTAPRSEFVGLFTRNPRVSLVAAVGVAENGTATPFWCHVIFVRSASVLSAVLLLVEGLWVQRSGRARDAGQN
jgi:hypothetical protein